MTEMIKKLAGKLRTAGAMLENVPGVRTYEDYAKFLIAEGVMVQECGYWISLTDCANEGVYCSVCNKKVYKADYAWCNRKNKLRSDYCPHCGAKMLPEPPKGE